MHDCPTELQLAAFAGGALPEEERERVQAHVARCAACGPVWSAAAELNGLRREGALPEVCEGERAAARSAIARLALSPQRSGAIRKTSPLSAFFAGLIDVGEAVETMLSSPLLAGEKGLLARPGNAECLAMHLCALRCEAMILRGAGVTVEEETLVAQALAQGWFVPGGGTPIAHLGKLLEAHGLAVERYFHADVDVLRHALDSGYRVMVAVDGGELLKRGRLARWLERMEDFVARIPDHCVLVTAVSGADGACEVSVLDPASPERTVVISGDTFYDAWEDSDFFLLAAACAASPPLGDS